MKDFLIMKRTSECNLLGINCALKVENFGSHTVISGEIFTTFSVKTKLLAYLKCKTKTVNLLDGESLRFKKEFSVSDIKDGFTAVIVDGENFTPLLYYNYGEYNYPYNEIISESFYDDEKISTVNYYEGENYETKRVYNDDDGGSDKNKKSPSKNEPSNETFLYEKFNAKCEDKNFYSTIKDRLDKIIYCYPKDKELRSVIPNAEFVKIYYDENRFYLVGRVFEDGEVKYLCYAVKGVKGETPKGLSPYCKFLPLDNFDLSVGYYVIFQCAKSGKIV